MPLSSIDPADLFNQAITGITSRFVFETPSFVVGRAHSADLSNDIEDVDIYDGLVVSSHGYGRVAKHKPTGTICLFTSKESYNLKGERQEDGSIIPSQEGLNRSYIVAAYRSNGMQSDVYRVAPAMRRALKRFWEDLGERSEKHFTKYGARIDGITGLDLGGFDDMTEVHTNGRLDYLLSRRSDRYRLRFIAPTRRKNGSFVPPVLVRFSMRDIFSGVSKSVSSTLTYERARHNLAHHWQTVSARLWDEKNLFEGEGLTFRTKKIAAGIINAVSEKLGQISLVTGLTGATIGTLVNPAYGFFGGIAAAVVHTGIHLVFDESFRFSNEMWKRSKEARSRLDLDAYPLTGDVSDHFKIQTPQNIKKICSKMDMARFPADQFEFLTSDNSGLLMDHEHANDGFYPSSLNSYLLTAHQRGFSSSCVFPDKMTMVNIFQSGLVRLIHERPNGQVVVYGRYRRDACTDSRVQMPTEKQDKFGNRIICFQYDRRRRDFYHAFKASAAPVTVETMMADMDASLFASQPSIRADVKTRSLQSIRETFERVANNAQQVPHLYMSGRPPAVPFLEAIL